MKKTMTLLCSLLSAALISASAQQKAVPMTVSIAPESSNIPAESVDFLTTRLNAAITRSGMGATSDFCQFYLSCASNELEKHIIPGAPTKYYQTTEMNFFIVDAFAQKVFCSTSIETKGIGNSEQQAATASIRQVSPSNKTLTSFLQDASRKILAYYDAQYKVIISKAQSFAKVYRYEEALFELAMVPEACAGYPEVVDVANGIYQKYLDDQANRNLAKATAIWNAGQNAAAAAEAAVYLAQIMPEAGCYQQAVSLNNEIKARVKSDIDYNRAVDSEERARAHQETMTGIEAWKAVGVAYGNNQKSQYYKSTF